MTLEEAKQLKVGDTLSYSGMTGKVIGRSPTIGRWEHKVCIKWRLSADSTYKNMYGWRNGECVVWVSTYNTDFIWEHYHLTKAETKV